MSHWPSVIKLPLDMLHSVAFVPKLRVKYYATYQHSRALSRRRNIQTKTLGPRPIEDNHWRLAERDGTPNELISNEISGRNEEHTELSSVLKSLPAEDSVKIRVLVARFLSVIYVGVLPHSLLRTSVVRACYSRVRYIYWHYLDSYWPCSRLCQSWWIEEYYSPNWALSWP